MVREAVYARASKEEGQEAENQLLVLRAEVERDEHELVGVYVDRESGRKGKRERSEFARMFKDAERRRFDVLRFWALQVQPGGDKEDVGLPSAARPPRHPLPFAHRAVSDYGQRTAGAHRPGRDLILRGARSAAHLRPNEGGARSGARKGRSSAVPTGTSAGGRRWRP